jgi:putative toxin-antitoxin system antitoxin component (TIGR02293 family)
MTVTTSRTARPSGYADPVSKQSAGRLGFVRQINSGFPVDRLESLARQISPDNAAFKYQVIAKATLERRKKTTAKMLSPEESAKVARISRSMNLAIEVWKSEEAARAFLFRPHPLLEMQTPIDVIMMNEFGAELVGEILLKLKYGTDV